MVVGRLLIRYIAAVHVTTSEKFAKSSVNVFEPDSVMAFSRLIRLVMKVNYLEYAKYDWGCVVSCQGILLPIEQIPHVLDNLVNSFRAYIEELDEEHDLRVPKNWVLNTFKEIDNGELHLLQPFQQTPSYKVYPPIEEIEQEKIINMYIRLKLMPCMFLIVAKDEEKLVHAIELIDDPIISEWEIKYIAKYLQKHTYVRRKDQIFYICPIPCPMSDILDIYKEFVKDLEKELKKEYKKRKKKQ